VDWTKSDPSPLGPYGMTRSALLSATFNGILHCFPHLVPLNNGLIRAVKILSKPGTVTHVIRPTPVAGYCSGAYEKVLASMMGAWAQAFIKNDPTRVFAGTVNLQNCVISGMHPATKESYVAYLWMEGGQGARTFKDGPSFAMMSYGAGGINQSVEVHERKYPVIYTRVEVRQDSCGDGKFRGGYGMCRSCRFWGNARFSIHGDREQFTPYGLAGGTNGSANLMILNVGALEERYLGMYATNVLVRSDDEILLCSNGGGGFGDPYKRDPKLVLEDVIDGFMSFEKALLVYGVAIKVINQEKLHYEVDWEETKILRLKRRVEIKQGYGPGEIHPNGEKVKVNEY